MRNITAIAMAVIILESCLAGDDSGPSVEGVNARLALIRSGDNHQVILTMRNESHVKRRFTSVEPYQGIKDFGTSLREQMIVSTYPPILEFKGQSGGHERQDPSPTVELAPGSEEVVTWQTSGHSFGAGDLVFPVKGTWFVRCRFVLQDETGKGLQFYTNEARLVVGDVDKVPIAPVVFLVDDLRPNLNRVFLRFEHGRVPRIGEYYHLSMPMRGSVLLRVTATSVENATATIVDERTRGDVAGGIRSLFRANASASLYTAATKRWFNAAPADLLDAD